MIEQAMYFILGFLVAALLLLTLLPSVWRRAQRISMRRLRGTLPISLEEVEAERALLRAGCAVRERRLEQNLKAMAEHKAQVMADAGRQTVRLIDLNEQLAMSEIRATCLDGRLSEARNAVAEVTNLLKSTKSELDALRLSKEQQDRVLEATTERLNVFERRHLGEADIETVAHAVAAAATDSGRLQKEGEAGDRAAALQAAAARRRGWSDWAEDSAMDTLAPGQAIAFLQSQGHFGDESGARKLEETVGALPLALNLAAACCRRTGLGFADFAARVGVLMAASPLGNGPLGSLTATFNLAAAQAIKEAPATEALIACLAYCAPQPVPLSLVDAAVGDERERAAAVKAATAFSLVVEDRYDDGAPALRMHSLLRESARSRAAGTRGVAAVLEKAISRLIEIYPLDGYGNPDSWTLCGRLTPHLLAVCDEPIADDSCGAERAELMVRAGGYFQGRGADDLAQSLFGAALNVREQVFGPDHPETAASLNNLASIRIAQGDFAGAEPPAKRAVEIFEKAFGSNYPPTGRYETCYARSLLLVGRPAQALPFSENALKSLEKGVGPEHLWTKDAARVNADALDALGRVAQAEAVRVHFGLQAATDASGIRRGAGAASMGTFARRLVFRTATTRLHWPLTSAQDRGDRPAASR